jgi:hypothetical protein
MNEEIIDVAGCGDKITIDVGATGISSVISVNGRYGYVVLTKDDVGLGNVDNTSDWDKPLSRESIIALGNRPFWDAAYTSIYVNSAIWTETAQRLELYLPLSGGTLNGDLHVDGTVSVGDVVFTEEYVTDPTAIARNYFQTNTFLKVFVNGSVPRYIPLFQFDLYETWIDEFGNYIVTENGTNLLL